MSRDPSREEERLLVIDRLGVLDTPPEACFDALVGLAASLCHAPMSAITLLARDRQWLKARQGIALSETARSEAICVHTIDRPGLLVIPDTREDPRTSGLPHVRAEEGIRFYAGAPLVTTSGHTIGALCVLDTSPRPAGLTEEQGQALLVLAVQVVAQLELRQALRTQEALLDEQRRAREALARSEERLRLAGEATHDLLWEIDLVTGSSEGLGRLRRLFGENAPHDLAGFMKRVHPDDYEALRRSFRAAVLGRGETWSMQFRYLGDGGAVRWSQARARLLRDERGWTVRVYGALLDVTEEMTLREQMVQSERLASVGALSGGVAHEMNNPLACVLSNLTWLRGDLRPGQCTDDQLAAIDDAVHGAERLQRIVADLRTFAQEGNDVQGPVEVEAAVRSALTLTRAQLTDRAMLTEELSRVPPVTANLPKLTQVMVHLLRNAVQAVTGVPGTRRVTVRTGLAGAGSVYVDVEDTGEGMCESVRRRAFEPFFTTRAVGAGQGLGLSVCHGLVKQMGGTMELSSEPGRGTRVRVVLTASAPPRPFPATGARATEEAAAP